MTDDDAKDAIDCPRACVLANISRGAMWDVEMCTKAVALIERQQSENARLAAEVADLKTENIGLRRCEHADGQALRIAELRIAKLKAEVERLTPKPMTLQEACDVLNGRCYEGFNDWECDDDSAWPKCKEGDVQFDDDGVADLGPVLSRISTVYVAQGLERDAGPLAVREPARGEERGE